MDDEFIDLFDEDSDYEESLQDETPKYSSLLEGTPTDKPQIKSKKVKYKKLPEKYKSLGFKSITIEKNNSYIIFN